MPPKNWQRFTNNLLDRDGQQGCQHRQQARKADSPLGNPPNLRNYPAFCYRENALRNYEASSFSWSLQLRFSSSIGAMHTLNGSSGLMYFGYPSQYAITKAWHEAIKVGRNAVPIGPHEAYLPTKGRFGKFDLGMGKNDRMSFIPYRILCDSKTILLRVSTPP